MDNFEKPGGTFYLGKQVDPLTGKPKEEPFRYDSKKFLTHAVCLGMTGSGKTGLGITILEEAGLAGIPAIIIDPKGDLGNLLLTFPHLSAEEFLPWVDELEAERKGLKTEAYAKDVAETWKEGLSKWGETSERIQKFRDSVEPVIYTPASNAGIPVSILSSFKAPSKEFIENSGAFRDTIMSTTSSILGLIGISGDSIKSREHILISKIFEQAWLVGKDLNIADLIRSVQKPTFEKIGALDTDTFFPQKDRVALSVTLNNLLASPGFQAWMQGNPLDVKEFLRTKEGKPKFSIFSIAHLSDQERMFFVTLLLNEIIVWMRGQPGTSSLRAILYMDEIFGYFPPISMPPSKMPMLTLLKQARAYGLGVILSTQNPVDLDYKGLSNCGTWFIGKLQTERDRARVCEGLRIASNGDIDLNTIDKMLSAIGNRTFIMRSIYEKQPILFMTRWTMSYLRGPLTSTLIGKLTKKNLFASTLNPVGEGEELQSSIKPLIPPDISEFFMKSENDPGKINYIPYLLGIGKVHFVDAKNKIDLWKDVNILASFDEKTGSVLWQDGKECDPKSDFEREPVSARSFSTIPKDLMQSKNYSGFEKEFIAFLYRNQTFNLYMIPDLGLISGEEETEENFKIRAIKILTEKRDEKIAKLREKYEGKISSLTNKVRLSRERLDARKKKAFWGKMEAFLAFMSPIIGALFGKGVTKGTITQTGTSIKRAGKIIGQDSSTAGGEEVYNADEKQLEDLRLEMQSEMEKISNESDEKNLKTEVFVIRPRKSDVSAEKIALVWI